MDVSLASNVYYNFSRLRLLFSDSLANVFKKQVDVPMMMNSLIGTISHMLVSLDFYRSYHKMEALTDEEFEKIIKKKLSAHVKIIFKAILTNES